MRSEQLVQHANSAGKTSISVACSSPIRLRTSGVSVESHRDRENGGWIEQSIIAGGVGSIAGRVDRRTAARPRPRQDSKMGTIFLISFCLGLATGHFRGPHHPRSSVSHHHYTPQKEVKLTQDTELLHDATHLQEDMGPIADQLDFSKMTEQEIEFHYFQIHDVDNNTKLDGLEILHALQHTLHENDKEDIDQDWIVGLVDKVLEEDDLNNDGYLEYVEYVLGRQRDHITQEKRNKLRLET